MFLDFLMRPEYKYLFIIKNKNIRDAVVNFFSPPVTNFVDSKLLFKLAYYINKDIEKGVFELNRVGRNVAAFSLMNEEQLNSSSHTLFLKIIKNYFGPSAYKMLKQRKNINVFNLPESLVLHQDVFDNFGEVFVTRILNNNLTPQSLIVIKNILSDRKEMKNFKFYCEFYKEYIGDDQLDFERMIKTYNYYKELINNIVSEKKNLSDVQKETLVDILIEGRNSLGIKSVEDIDSYEDQVEKKYEIDKKVAKERSKNSHAFLSLHEIANIFFKKNFNVTYMSGGGLAYFERNAYYIFKRFDLNDILNGEMGQKFTEEEIGLLRDLYEVSSLAESNKRENFDKIMEYCEKYDGYNTNLKKVAIRLFDKLPKIYERELNSTVSTVEDIERRVSSKEKGVYRMDNPVTKSGMAIDSPVYVFDGADFAFVSTTSSIGFGMAGNYVQGDFASFWFEYENGTNHICCSYANQDKLSNLEFNRVASMESPVTYFFDEFTLYAMGSEDLFSSHGARTSTIRTTNNAFFLPSSKLVEKTDENSYNEVDISRYNYDGEISFGGKIIPSGILCCDEVSDVQLEAAQSFTKYCVEHGLRPEGWKMPIVVVDKKKYIEIQNMKKEGLIYKNSEYFTRSEEKEKTKEIAVKQVEQQVEKVKQSSGKPEVAK